jgi:hypothetical protein
MMAQSTVERLQGLHLFGQRLPEIHLMSLQASPNFAKFSLPLFPDFTAIEGHAEFPTAVYDIACYSAASLIGPERTPGQTTT